MRIKSLAKSALDIIMQLIIPAIVGILVGSIINLFIGFTSVSGMSMYPTLEDKDFLFMNKMLSDSADNGDIVVFDTTPDAKYKDKIFYIKRVIAKEGDHLVISDGKVKLNDKVLKEDYTDGSYTEGEVDVIIPKGKYFVLGDNRDGSTDSRVFGLVSQEDIEGVVKARVLPLKPISNK